MTLNFGVDLATFTQTYIYIYFEVEMFPLKKSRLGGLLIACLVLW
jgi:hypothetical protein